MASDLPVTSPGPGFGVQRIGSTAFALLAVLLTTADALLYKPTAPAWIVLLVVLGVSLAAAGGYPRAAAGTYASILMIALLLPSSVITVGVLTFGVYAIAALWIYKGWRLAAVLCLIVYSAVHIPGDYNTAAFLEILLGTALAVLLGIGSRHLSEQLWRARTQLAQEKTHALEALAEAKRSTALALHDTAAAHLVRAIAAQEEALAFVGPQASEPLTAALGATRAAMADLRLIIDSSTSNLPLPDSLHEVLTEGMRLLSYRGIVLEPDTEADLIEDLDSETRALLLMIIREGCINVFKHGARNSTASLTVESSGSARFPGLGLTLVNVIGTDEKNEVAGGIGLAGLARRASLMGASIETHRIEERWLLSAGIPLRNHQGGDAS